VYETRGDNNRKIEIGKTVTFLKGYSKPINDFDEIEDEMPNVSDFIKDKLHEYFDTGSIKESESSSQGQTQKTG
jgi:DNA polymerase/3'-5' exonuclease PolX